jgi:ABC-type lipoprotein release transport system permease subunit
VHAPLGVWRVSLERMRADWPIVGAAWLITLLAATLLAAGPIYSSAVSLAGLHRVLADAPVPSANVQVTFRGEASEAEAHNTIVSRMLREATGDVPVTVLWSGRSNTFALPGQDPDEVRDLATLGFADGIEEHTTLVAGSWPVDAAGETVGVAVSEEVAAELGAAIGDQMRLTSRLDSSVRVTIRITGIYHVRDPADAFWYEDEELLAGSTISDRYRTIGPLITTRANVLARSATSTLQVTWHGFPDFGALGVDGTGALRAGVESLSTRLDGALPGVTPQVVSELDTLLAQSERSLLVSRTGVLLLIIQLAVLAAYAIVLTAGLLVEHRRVQTALMRSRGAGTGQIAMLALAEGLLLALPAALLGPWLAAWALGLLNVAGPLAQIALDIEPLVSGDAYLASGVAALGCVVLLVLPTIAAARTFAAEQSGISRQETRTIGQRIGIDVALLAVTLIALWQLRLYGSPLTQSVRGTLGLDPLLVAAPAIALLAGGVLALRVMPLLAELGERLVARGRHLIGSLGARQLARRPLRYTRAALLLMLAISMGIFAVSYSSTWADSQLDQAAYQVGADVRVVPRRGPSALPGWAQANAIRSLPGVTAATPVHREPLTVTRAAGSGELIGLDPNDAGLVTFRGDLANEPLATVLQPLVDGREALSLIELPGAPLRLRVGAEVLIESLLELTFDPDTGQSQPEAVPLSVLDGYDVLGASVVLRDADGLTHRFAADPIGLNPEGDERLEVSLVVVGDDPGAASLVMSAPVTVLAVELQVSLPGLLFATDGAVGVTSLEWSTTAADDDWQALDLASGGGWNTTLSVPGQGFGTAVDTPDGRMVPLSSSTQLLGDGFTPGDTNVITSVASSLARMTDAALPVVVNGTLLDRTAAAVGDEIQVRLFGETRALRIVGAVRSFPTADPARPLVLADLPTLEVMRFATALQVAAADEWWLDAADGMSAAVAEGTSAAPISATSVITRDERGRLLSADPVALGIIGALSVGFVVAGLFAVIGLAVSAAVSARQRRTEFALLRALGMSGGELGRWLWLENVAVVAVSLVAGTTLGLIIGWVVLPFITVTQQGGAPFPPVLLEVPWAAIGLLELLSIGALVMTVLLLARVLRRFGIGSVLRMGED